MKTKIDVNEIRIQNMRSVITAIASGQKFSRAEIAAITHLSLATVSNIVNEFVSKGVIKEVKDNGKVIGRKPYIVSLVSEAMHFAVVDIRTYQFKFSIFDCRQTEITNYKFDYNPLISFTENYELLIKKLYETTVKLELIETPFMVGFITPGPYITELDEVKCKRMTEFTGVHLEAIARKYFSCDLRFGEDVKLAAFANLMRNKQLWNYSVCYVYIWEGMGGVFIDHGKILHGANNAAFNVGQICLNEGQTIEEQVCYRSLINAVSSNIKDEVDIIRLIKESDDVKNAIDEILEKVSFAILNICWIFDPNCIIIESCYNFLKEYFLEIIQKILKKRLYKRQMERIEIILSDHNIDLAKIGCYYFLRDEWFVKLCGNINE